MQMVVQPCPAGSAAGRAHRARASRAGTLAAWRRRERVNACSGVPALQQVARRRVASPPPPPMPGGVC